MLYHLDDQERPAHCVYGRYPSQTSHEFDRLLFTSEFDSGNLLLVEQISDSHFAFKTAPDCYQTQRQRPYQSWFYFKVVNTGNISEKVKFTFKNFVH